MNETRWKKSHALIVYPDSFLPFTTNQPNDFIKWGTGGQATNANFFHIKNHFGIQTSFLCAFPVCISNRPRKSFNGFTTLLIYFKGFQSQSKCNDKNRFWRKIS